MMKDFKKTSLRDIIGFLKNHKYCFNEYETM